MTEEDRRNYRSTVSRRWKEISEDPERLIKYDNRAKYTRDKAEKVKPTELGDYKHDSLVGDMVQYEEKVKRSLW